MSHLQVLLFFQAEEKENHSMPQMTGTKQNMGNAHLFNCCLVILKKKTPPKIQTKTRTKPPPPPTVMTTCFPRTPLETMSCLCALIWFSCIHLFIHLF